MTNILLMRQEIILISIILILLVAAIYRSNKEKSGINSLALVLVALLTIVGFLPSETGSLFGGMYQPLIDDQPAGQICRRYSA